MKFFLAPVLGALLTLPACGDLFSEGDPVEPKTGILAKWQADSDPNRIMEFSAGGKGHYNNGAGFDQDFSYTFTDEDTIKITFQNGNSMDMDVRTTTLYLWVTNEDGTDRLHKYE